VARLDLPSPVLAYLARWGAPIRYDYVDREWPIGYYQTIFATPSSIAGPGSAEMPSAGRAFSPAVLRALEQRGVLVVRLTLHTGVASAEHDEPPYEEPFAVPWETASAVNAAREAGRRVIATGTTCVRALESVTDEAGRAVAARGWTELVVTPQRGVRLVDALLTGFHEPRASHLLMLEAIAGRAHLRRAYRAALDGGYLWHEFGDLHLIL
jgi:S-adenosylmethionine:tRNA ribosyltransferase-isomerase